MFPIILDLSQTRILLIGKGAQAERRLQQFHDAGLDKLELKTHLNEPDLDNVHVVYVVGLPDQESREIAKICRNRNILVNVEDVKDLCDFHTPSLVRRGDLLLTISTRGKSPGLAVTLRKYLEERFPPIWSERLDRLAHQRDAWREEGLSMGEILHKTQDLIKEKGWLK